jgi:hypothetical protein
MKGFEPSQLRQLFEAAAKEPTSSLRGQAYERAIRYIFESSGCLVEANQTNVLGAEEVDLGVGNLTAMPLLPKIFIVECKDWDSPVDSRTVGYFINIVRNRSLELGIVVAPKGMTGSDDDLTYAQSLGLAAAAQNIKIIVLTSSDLSEIQCITEFVELLHRRYLRAQVNGGVGVPRPEDKRLMRHSHDETCPKEFQP